MMDKFYAFMALSNLMQTNIYLSGVVSSHEEFGRILNDKGKALKVSTFMMNVAAEELMGASMEHNSRVREIVDNIKSRLASEDK